MSNVDGSIVLGVRLSEEDLDSQARRIGDKVRSAIEGSLKNSDILKVIKVEGGGRSHGEVYGEEFLNAFLKVLKSGNAGSAKLFDSTFKSISKESEKAANDFSATFQKILGSNGSKIANEFARGFQASFTNGGERSANQFSSQFQGKLTEAARKSASEMKTVLEAPSIPQSFVNNFSSILAKSGSSTARQFSATWNQIYQVAGEKSANEFSEKFQKVLKKGGGNRANEYAKGMALAYDKAGEDAANNFSKNFKNRSGVDFKNIGKFMRDTLVSAIGNGLSNMVSSLLNGIFSTIRSTISGITGFIGDSIGKALTNQKKFIELKAITGASEPQIQKIEKEVRTTSLNTPTKVPELTEVALELSKAGIPLDNINQKLLTSISLMGRLSGESANDTAGMVAQIQSSFALPLSDMVQTMDLMTAVANGSQASIGSLSQGMTYAGATAKALGVDVKETAFLLGVLANNGLDASRGGTALQNMFSDMAKNSKTLKEIGVNVFDENGVQRFQAAIGELRDKLKGLSNEDQYKVLSDIFGERGLRGVQALMTGLDPLDEKTQQLSKNIEAFSGSLERAGDQLNSPAAKLDLLTNKIDEFRDRFGQAFEPGINALADFGNQTMDYLLNNTSLFDTLNQANQEFANFLSEHPEYAQMLAEIISELANELFTTLLDQTKQLLAYLKENPNAVRELLDSFKGFASMVIDILPKVAKLVEMLYNGAKFLGLINDGSNNPNAQKPFSGESLEQAPLKNAIVTSAVDASGEPGLDYVNDADNNGGYGAGTPSLTNGVVVETETNKGEEFRLDEGDSRRGYGNTVVVRTVDEKTGEIVDILYAHFKDVAVNVGDEVIIGTKLGTQGRSGSTTGTHTSVDFHSKGGAFAGSGGGTSNAAIALRDRIARQIANGKLEENGQMPSQNDLSDVNITRKSLSNDEPDNLSVVTGGKISAKSSARNSDEILVTRKNTSPKMSLPSGLTSKGQELSQYLTNPRIRAFFDAVSMAEGTANGSKGGYDVSFGGGYNTNLNTNHFNYGRELTPSGNSSASGRYQAMGHSWAEEAQKLGLKKMDPVSQDLFALGRLDMRGLTKTIATKDPSQYSADDWQQIAYEWASVSPGEGRASAYAGQGTSKGSQSNFIKTYRDSMKGLSKSSNPIDSFKGKSGLPQYQSLNLLGDSDPIQEMIGLKDGEASKFDKLRSKREKEMEKILKQQEALEKKLAQETKKNAAESLKLRKETAKEIRDRDKAELESSIESKKIQYQGTEFADDYDTSSKVAIARFDNQTELQNYKMVLEDIEQKIKEINESRSEESGIKEVLTSYQEQKKVIQGIIEDTKKIQAEEIKNIQAANNGKLAIERKKQVQEEFVKVFEREKKLRELQQAQSASKVQDGDFRSVLENSFKISNLGIEKTIKTQPLEFEIKRLEEEIKQAKDSGLDFTGSIELMQAKLDALKADLASVNQEFQIVGDTIQSESEKILKAKLGSFQDSFDSSRSSLLQSTGNSVLDAELNRIKAINIENERFRKNVEEINLLKSKDPGNSARYDQMLDLNRQTNRTNTLNIDSTTQGYSDKLFDSRIEQLKRKGFGFQAAEMEEAKAQVEEVMRFRQEMETISSLKGKIPDEELEAMMRAAKEINGINLDGIKSQFDTLGNTIGKTLVDEFKNFTMKAITDFDNIGEAINGLIDNLLNRFLELMLNQAFSSILGGGGGFLGGLFGGGGSGLDLALDVPLFANGGMVAPNGTSNYSDSIMALLSPGEAVLSAGVVNQLAGTKPASISPAFEGGGTFSNVSVTTIVNVDGNGNVSTEKTGYDSFASDIEKMIVSRVTQMATVPGGLLNND